MKKPVTCSPGWRLMGRAKERQVKPRSAYQTRRKVKRIDMNYLLGEKSRTALLRFSTVTLLSAGLAFSFVTPNTRTFTAGEKAKVQGVIISREGNVLKLRGTDDSVGTVDLSENTEIRLKHGVFGKKS